MILALSIAGIVFAIVPAMMFLANLPRFELGEETIDESKQRQGVAVPVPARDESASIRGCLNAALDSRLVEVEVVVLDDDSSDGTDVIIKQMAAEDLTERDEGWNPLISSNRRRISTAISFIVSMYFRLEAVIQ